MRRTFHRLRRRGPVDRRVAVRPQRPWYWKALALCIPLAVGYALGHWHGYIPLTSGSLPMRNDANALAAQFVRVERQLQVERATRSNAVKEMALLQDEIMRLKEDVAFYKGILAERGASGMPKFQSVNLVKGAHPGEYRYRIHLTQAGRQDRPIRGSLRLILQTVQDGKTVSRNVGVDGQQQSIMVNFKKYRQVDGAFNVPATIQAQSLIIEFTETGGERPTLAQAVSLPD